MYFFVSECLFSDGDGGGSENLSLVSQKSKINQMKIHAHGAADDSFLKFLFYFSIIRKISLNRVIYKKFVSLRKIREKIRDCLSRILKANLICVQGKNHFF